MQWDIKNKRSTGKGVVGTICAFAAGNEEHSCETLCGHWQVYVEQPMNELCHGLFQRDNSYRLKARQNIVVCIDLGMSVSYGEEITTEHRFIQVEKEPTNKIGTVGQLFQQRPL